MQGRSTPVSYRERRCLSTAGMSAAVHRGFHEKHFVWPHHIARGDVAQRLAALCLEKSSSPGAIAILFDDGFSREKKCRQGRMQDP